MEDLSVADALALRNDGGEDNWMWIIILFLFLFGFGGGGGFGGNNVANSPSLQGMATRQDITDGFNFQKLDNGVNGLSQGICNLGYEMAREMGNVNQTTQALGFQLQGAIDNCCCATNRNIDSVKFDAQLNTRAIMEANCQNTQKILDRISADKEQALYAKINGLELASTIQNQSQALLAQLRPTPIPAYVTCSPYVTSTPYGC